MANDCSTEFADGWREDAKPCENESAYLCLDCGNLPICRTCAFEHSDEGHEVIVLHAGRTITGLMEMVKVQVAAIPLGDYSAKRYNTDDTCKVYLYNNGHSYDISLPRCAAVSPQQHLRCELPLGHQSPNPTGSDAIEHKNAECFWAVGQPNRCCENGCFGDGHHCRKQPGGR